jgi:hypothetical protein
MVLQPPQERLFGNTASKKQMSVLQAKKLPSLKSKIGDFRGEFAQLAKVQPNISHNIQ